MSLIAWHQDDELGFESALNVIESWNHFQDSPANPSIDDTVEGSADTPYRNSYGVDDDDDTEGSGHDDFDITDVVEEHKAVDNKDVINVVSFFWN